MSEANDPVLSHLDALGRVRMVDVSDKPLTRREAVASARIGMAPETLKLILAGPSAKGDVLATARIAGIMAAKRTGELIPLCHPLPLDSVTVELTPDGPDGLRVLARVATVGRTGVEMEALTAAAMAALTVYDMAKSADRKMVISDLRLEEKLGGRSGHFLREMRPVCAEPTGDTVRGSAREPTSESSSPTVELAPHRSPP